MKKTLKHLADAYFFENAQISPKQFDVLRASKYSRIFNHKPYKQTTLLEQNQPTYPRQMSGNVGVQKLVLKELVDHVETQFGMDLSKPLHGKYSNIDIEQLKESIAQFEAETAMTAPTKMFIQNLLNADTIESIFYGLYSV